MPLIVEWALGDVAAERRCLRGGHALIGRATGNELAIPDARVSKTHAQLSLHNGVWRVEDLGSTNGSALWRQGAAAPVPLVPRRAEVVTDGDRLLLGDLHNPVMLTLGLVSDTGGLLAGGGNDADTAEVVGVVGSPAGADPDKTVAATRSPARLDAPQLTAALSDAKRVRQLLALHARADQADSPDGLWDAVARALLEAFPRSGATAVFTRFHRPGDATPRVVAEVARDAALKGVEPTLERVADRVFSQGEAVLIDAQRDPASDPRLGALRGALLAPVREGMDSGVGASTVSAVLAVLFARDETLPSPDSLDWLSAFAWAAAGKLTGLRLLDEMRRREARLKVENRMLKGTAPATRAPSLEMVGRSPALAGVRRIIEKVARADVPVLISGETGTGKELAAREIHLASGRAQGPFAAVNCGALAETLLESELFGHVKGAFTGASETRRGFFEAASGGTLFLDEIGEMPARLQVKLLRVLQEGEVIPVGANRAVPVDVRVVAATNRDLHEMARVGTFREDLLYRINTVTLKLPPLRERGDDVLALAEYFLREFARDRGLPPPPLSNEARELLLAADWPGNIRQLKNEMQRAVLLSDGEIRPEDFSPAVRAVRTPSGTVADSGSDAIAEADPTPALERGEPLRDILEHYEIQVIRKALDRCDWNKTRAAQRLGISRQAFMVKLSKFGISKPGLAGDD